MVQTLWRRIGKSNQSTDAPTLWASNPRNLAYKHTHTSPKWNMIQVFHCGIICVARIRNNSSINNMELPELTMVHPYNKVICSNKKKNEDYLYVLI